MGRVRAALLLAAERRSVGRRDVTLQDIGSIGELVGAIATVATLVYLAIQIRHNSRGLDQNSELMRMSFEHQLRGEGQQLRALIASDPDLAAIWRAGLAGDAELDQSQRDRFELLIVNVLNMLKAEYDGFNRGLATDHRATYLFIVAGTPGFRQWWNRHHRTGRDVGFGEWIDSLTARGSESEAHAAQQATVEPDVE
ncbi:MAG: hypothetical protein JRJ24_16710 [Deltaproteobacteria bacterium]|nr:hypothetical protein [Deltaproteobacteria bacterium]